MLKLLLIDVALGVVLIVVAALVVTGRWRRSNGRLPAPAGARGVAAGRAGKAMAPREIAIVPGFSDTVRPDRGTHVPVQPEQAGHSQARPAARPGPDPHRLGPRPNGQRAPVRPLTASEQITSYYDRADKPMADYLTAMGWTDQPPPRPESPGPAERPGRRPPPSGAHRQ
jgi:hypothetical protein